MRNDLSGSSFLNLVYYSFMAYLGNPGCGGIYIYVCVYIWNRCSDMSGPQSKSLMSCQICAVSWIDTLVVSRHHHMLTGSWAFRLEDGVDRISRSLLFIPWSVWIHGLFWQLNKGLNVKGKVKCNCRHNWVGKGPVHSIWLLLLHLVCGYFVSVSVMADSFKTILCLF